MSSTSTLDYVIVGGGLQGCLLAHALAWHRPEARVLLVERSPDLCGNHTWSFHGTDVPERAAAWFDGLVDHHWPGYVVKFPGLTRRVKIPYATITSDRLRQRTHALAAEPAGVAGRRTLDIRTGLDCEICSPTCVRLGDGTEITSAVVVDCRGRRAVTGRVKGAGYQTFVGHEYQTHPRWPVSEPTVMEVRGDQAEGFEFLYELPLGPDRVLLEYTRFHEEPECDEPRARERIKARLTDAGIGAVELVRTEHGCLPMPYAAPSPGDAATSAGGVVAGGYAGGWYHAATGYSMPLAIRFAELVARARPERVAAEVAAAAREDAVRRAFARFLNRLLFCLVKPADRWKIFRRFYGVLSDEQIARFYGHRFTAGDAARIVVGRPPTGLAPIRFARSFFPCPGVLQT